MKEKISETKGVGGSSDEEVRGSSRKVLFNYAQVQRFAVIK